MNLINGLAIIPIVFFLTMTTFDEQAYGEPELQVYPKHATLGEEILIFALSSETENQSYYIDVYDPNGKLVDSTIWFAGLNFYRSIQTDDLNNDFTKSGAYTIAIVKADNNLEKTTDVIGASSFFIKTPPPQIELMMGTYENFKNWLTTVVA